MLEHRKEKMDLLTFPLSIDFDIVERKLSLYYKCAVLPIVIDCVYLTLLYKRQWYTEW